MLTGNPVDSVDDAKEACKNLLKKGCQEVILTMGGQGLVFASSSGIEYVQAPKIENVVDTTVSNFQDFKYLLYNIN